MWDDVQSNSELHFINKFLRALCGGESGIRTHGTVSRTHAFQACALSHSAISPDALSWRAKAIFASKCDSTPVKFR